MKVFIEPEFDVISIDSDIITASGEQGEGLTDPCAFGEGD